MNALKGKCERCWQIVNIEDLSVDNECKHCVKILNSDPRNMEWGFRYRAYKKQRVIQLKPVHDNTNHFSIIWTKNKKNMTEEHFNQIDQALREYIISNNNKMSFRIIRACKNCTYGRFEQSFEDIILGLRKQYDICAIKDLTLDDTKHEFLKKVEVWDVDHPIIHHIHSKSETDDQDQDQIWTDFLRNSSRNSTLLLNIVFEPTS